MGVRFYYDFYNKDKQMTDADLKLIKKEMEKIIKQKLPLLREEVSRCVDRPSWGRLTSKRRLASAVIVEPYHLGGVSYRCKFICVHHTFF